MFSTLLHRFDFHTVRSFSESFQLWFSNCEFQSSSIQATKHVSRFHAVWLTNRVVFHLHACRFASELG